MKHEKAKLHILVVCQAGLGEIVKAEPLHNTLKANLLKSRQQIRFSRQLLQKNDFFSSKPRKPPRRAGVILHRPPNSVKREAFVDGMKIRLLMGRTIFPWIRFLAKPKKWPVPVRMKDRPDPYRFPTIAAIEGTGLTKGKKWEWSDLRSLNLALWALSGRTSKLNKQ